MFVDVCNVSCHLDDSCLVYAQGKIPNIWSKRKRVGAFKTFKQAIQILEEEGYKRRLTEKLIFEDEHFIITFSLASRTLAMANIGSIDGKRKEFEFWL